MLIIAPLSIITQYEQIEMNNKIDETLIFQWFRPNGMSQSMSSDHPSVKSVPSVSSVIHSVKSVPSVQSVIRDS